MARISSDAGLRAQWKPFRFIGNYSCLDFVNTETKESGQRVNLLRGFEDCDVAHFDHTVRAKQTEAGYERMENRGNERAHSQECSRASPGVARDGRGDCGRKVGSARQY